MSEVYYDIHGVLIKEGDLVNCGPNGPHVGTYRRAEVRFLRTREFPEGRLYVGRYEGPHPRYGVFSVVCWNAEVVGNIHD